MHLQMQGYTGDLGLVPRFGRSLEEGNGSILGWRNAMDRTAWRSTVHGVSNLCETISYLGVWPCIYSFTCIAVSPSLGRALIGLMTNWMLY